MDDAKRIAEEQAALWNGSAGQAWVETQAVADEMYRGIEELLVEAVRDGEATEVLDIGCGAGATTLAVARLLGPDGRCTGIDLSGPMLDAARARAAREGLPATFIQADAETHPFTPAAFDMLVSRFGVMFFADPVRAFANLRQATRPGGRLCCVAWRSPEDNAFMTTAERAARPLLPDLPIQPPDRPGQFGFADGGRVARILAESGWAAVDIRPIDLPCTLPEAALAPYLGRMGVLGRYLGQLDEADRSRVIERVRAAFEPFVDGERVRFTAACWLISARTA